MNEQDFRDRWPDMRMKHLELIQGVIARMANNSASTKNYSMTVFAGVISLAAATQKPEILLYAIPVILAFSLLDANYLRLENAFRDQYNSIRNEKLSEAADFLISPSWTTANLRSKIYFSWSVAGFYWPLISVQVFIYFMI